MACAFLKLAYDLNVDLMTPDDPVCVKGVSGKFSILQTHFVTFGKSVFVLSVSVMSLFSFRTISKLELENKRLGRENDNLRHKVTQSLK